MNNLWLKFKIWFKLILFGLIALYILLFLLKNYDTHVTMWLWFGQSGAYTSSILALVFAVFLLSVIGTLLTSTIWRTVHQIREASSRSRAQKLERAIADMNAKAAKLQTRPDPTPTSPDDPM
ncbi:MAG TPA: hypothetical protein VGQ99_16925 [Tepidisphaeraceae bacterium]|jgi:uncharacterized membrane protein|nr:hypothetical protein [Tepidisphaeraceae bacterium]